MCDTLAALTVSCFERSARATAQWLDRVSSAPVQHRPPRLFSLAWDRFFDSQSAFTASPAGSPAGRR